MSGGDTALRLDEVSFTYSGAARPALRDVDLSVGRGEMVVVMGASGAGKSTLARCCNGSIPSYQSGRMTGELWVGGERRTGCDVAALAGVVALVTQDFEAQLVSTNVALEVAFGMEQLGVQRDEMHGRLKEALATAGLAGFEGRDPSGLSGGEKQRLALAAVLAMRPLAIVLDEPTTDLDPRGKAEIFDVLRRLCAGGTAVLLIEHEIEAAESADRLVLLQEGRVAEEGRPDELLPRVDRLLDLGVRPHDLDRIATGLGLDRRFSSTGDAVGAIHDHCGVGKPPVRHSAEPEAPFLEVEGVSFAYPGGPPVLQDVSLSISSAERIAIVGANGSGKTTLSKQLNGLLSPVTGRVVLDGRDLAEQRLEDVARRVGYVFQNPDDQIFADTVDQEVRFGAEQLGLASGEIDARSADAARSVGIEDLGSQDPFALPKGDRQKLAIASLLVLHPHLLILDEPTTGLDYGEQRDVLELLERLRRRGVTVLVITHTAWLVAEFADRCLVLDSGRLISDGTTESFLRDAELMKRADFDAPPACRVAVALGINATSADDLLATLGIG